MNDINFSMNLKVKGIQFTFRGEDHKKFSENMKKGTEVMIDFFKTNPHLDEIKKLNSEFFADIVATKAETVTESVDKGDAMSNCTECGKAMIEKKGKYGKFLACSGYPTCKTTVGS